jgi:Cu/Ag efflux pump CusA
MIRKQSRRLILTLLAAVFPGPADAAEREPPPVVDVTVAWAGASVEEVERQVVVPLEVALAGMPRLKHIRSQCLPGLAHLRLHFESGTRLERARQEVINRLQFVTGLPEGATPQLSTATPADQILRYILRGPKDPAGKDIYTLNDLRSLQDWDIERQLRRVSCVANVLTVGGTVKCYEVQPDPDRLRRFDITLEQLQKAIATANANTGGDYVKQGAAALRVRAVGTFGGGADPLQAVLTLKEPREASARLRAEEQRRLREIRSLVVATVNSLPIRLEDLVEGGRLAAGEQESTRGVVVGHLPRCTKLGLARPGSSDEDDLVGGIVLLRPGEDPQLTLRRLNEQIKELNDGPSRLLPGVRIEPYCERGLAAGGDGQATAWFRGTFPLNVTLERVAEVIRQARALLLRHPEVRLAVSQIGVDDADACEFSLARILVVLLPDKDKPRTPAQLREELQAVLERSLPGVSWEVTPDFRDDFLRPFSAGPGEGLLKIVGPDLEHLEKIATRAQAELARTEGVSNAQVIHVWGPASLEFRVDPDKCRKWGVTVADVNSVVQTALGGSKITAMVEGDKAFAIRLLWPKWMRNSPEAILDAPVPVNLRPAAGPDKGPPPAATPRLRLRDLVSPVGDDGQPDPKGQFMRPGAVAIYRENGRRFIAVRFNIGAVDLAKIRMNLARLFEAPYRAEWEQGP